MFLGYSEKDESMLRQYNNLTVFDAVSSLDSFMREEVNNQVTHSILEASSTNLILAYLLCCSTTGYATFSVSFSRAQYVNRN